jgi:ABC-type transport system substrate-binding protein
VLIDEYDKPLNEAFTSDYYEEALAFLTSAFTGALKDNPYVALFWLTR